MFGLNGMEGVGEGVEGGCDWLLRGGDVRELRGLGVEGWDSRKRLGFGFGLEMGDFGGLGIILLRGGNSRVGRNRELKAWRDGNVL
jgi:hypothetical protein